MHVLWDYLRDFWGNWDYFKYRRKTFTIYFVMKLFKLCCGLTRYFNWPWLIWILTSRTQVPVDLGQLHYWYINAHSGLWVQIQPFLTTVHLTMSPRMAVNYDDIWNEVSSPEFVSAVSTTEYDTNTIRELALLLREGQNILNNPHALNQEQVNHLTAKLREVRAEIRRQAPLVRNLQRQ